MLRKFTAILLSFLMIFQMLPVTALAESAQENGGDFQVVESNNIEGEDTEEVFEINFVLEEEEEEPVQQSGRRRLFSTKSNKKGAEESPRGRGNSRVRRRGEKLGELPNAPSKKHMYRWFDRNSRKYVTEETEVTESMTLEPVGMNEEELSISDGGVSVVVPENAVPENTEFSAEPVSAESVAAAVESVVGEAGEIRAMDLTFTDTNIGEEVEPSKAVEVTMSVAGMDTSALTLIHIKDDGSKEIVPFTLSGNSIVFNAGSFSVYVVVESIVPRLTVTFKNGTTEIASMIIKAADTAEEVEKIIYDPGAGTIPANQIFKGWTTDEVYNKDSTLLTIAQVRSAAMTTAAGLTADDSVTYYAALYKQYTVTYVDGTDVIVGTEVVEIPSTETEASYPVNQGYSTDDTHNFEGWIVADGQSNIKNYPAGAESETVGGDTIYYYTNGTVITITGDVKFSVDAPEGYWLIFDENGKGATYNAPRFIKSGQTTSNADLLPMVRNGYTFVNWYTDRPDPTTEDPYPEPTGSVFQFGGTLSETTTIYAKWQSNTNANYTVLIWKQNDAGDGYDFVESVTVRNATVGSTPNAVNANTGAVTGGTYTGETGFHFKSTDQASKRVATEGNTVVNVYWDRNEITFNFNVYGYTYAQTTGNQGTQYGIVNGEYVELTRYNGTWYYYSGGWHTYSGTRYTRSSGWSVYKTMSGLYGSTLAANGYTWPTEYDWYASGGSNGSTSGTHTTFIDTFKETVSYYGRSVTTGTYTISHYKQNIDGSWPDIDHPTNQTSLNGNSTWTFTEKYDGFTVKYYLLSNNASSYWNNTYWTETSANSQTSTKEINMISHLM